MASEMIERVARAILAGHDWTAGLEPREVTGWDALPPDWQDAYRNMARAAIEAMREPTETMARNAFNRVVSDDWLDFLRGYRAMIDAALSEQEG